MPTQSKIYLRPQFDYGVVYTRHLPDKVVFKNRAGKLVFVKSLFPATELIPVVRALGRLNPDRPADLNWLAEKFISGPDAVARLLSFILNLKKAGLLKITQAPFKDGLFAHKSLFGQKYVKKNKIPARKITLCGPPDFTKKIKALLKQNSSYPLKIINLNPPTAKIKSPQNITGASELVIFFSPRPAAQSLALGRACLKQGEIFLNVEIDGIDVFCGPLVVPGKTPCYRCFKIRRKEAGFKDYEYILKKRTVLDGAARNLLVLRAAELAARMALDILNGCAGKHMHKVYAFNIYSNKASSLKLLRKNDCPDCSLENDIGGYTRFCAPEQSRISLDARRTVKYSENGLRIISAQETLGRLSGITGRLGVIIEHVRESRGRSKIFCADPMGNNIRRCATGKGLTPAQTRASASMEAVERYCSKMHRGEKLVTASYAQVEGVAKDPRIFHLSEKFPVKFSPQLVIDWNWGYSLLNKKTVLVPSNLVYCSYEPSAKASPIDTGWNSSGLGTGNCLEEAILHAIFELVERDAHFILYQNRITAPDIDARSSKSKLVHEMLDKFDRLGILYRVKSFTTDIKIPTIVTAIRTEIAGQAAYAYAVGTHLDPEIALLRSLTESVQGNLRLKGDSLWLKTSPIGHLYRQGSRVLKIGDFKDLSVKNLKDDIDICIRAFGVYQTDIIVVNLSRAYVDFPVVRVLIDCLQPIYVPQYPRYSKRMFSVPVILGYRRRPARKEELLNGALLGMAEDMAKF